MRRATSVAALCLVTFLQAYLLVSVFPYGAYLAVHLWNRPSAYAENTHPITVEEAGPYAALFATSFMIGRTAAAVIWGNLADVYGRKWVLLASLVGSGVASLWFGMCTSYANAVVARGVMGAWNSIVGVSKTLATELAYHDFGSDGDSGHDCAEECVQLSNEDLHLQEGNAIPSSCKVAVDHDATKEHLETRIVGLVTSMRYGALLHLAFLMGATKIAQSTFFSSVTIATNHTVPSDARSRMNGVGGMGAGVAKAVGPMLSGFWMARWLSLDHNAGRHLSFQSFVAFGGIASLAIPLLALLPLLDNDE
ncbi:hypothetical protein ACHAXT_006588 [Thalassiosira profunda]